MTRTNNTSKKAIENPASTEEETYTEKCVTATLPGIEISHNQALHSPFPYSGMMVPYVEGPKMDWTIDDALHSRFIRWKIMKCENFLDCKLAILQKSAKCKKVIQWSGDAGLDMYISWNLLTEVTLQTIWSRFKDFCKPQSNAVCAIFDLLTAF